MGAFPVVILSRSFADVARCAYLPVCRPHRAYILTQTNTRIFETAEMLGVGRMGERGKGEDPKCENHENGGLGGVMPSCWCSVGFRLVPWWPILATFLARRSSIRPPHHHHQYKAFRNRRNSGYRDRVKGEARGAQLQKPRQIGGFEGAMPPVGVPRGSVRFRRVPQRFIVPDGLSPHAYIPTTKPITGVSKPPKRRVLGKC